MYGGYFKILRFLDRGYSMELEINFFPRTQNLYLSKTKSYITGQP